MSGIDQFVDVMDALTRLFGVLVWPLLVLFVVVRFRPAIRDFFESLGEFSLKGAGVEASAKKKQIGAAASLAAAAAADTHEKTSASDAAKAAVDVVSDVLTNKAVRRASKSKILWVDDIPANNEAERESLEALGIGISIATSTEEALDILQRQRFDLVISDMGRPPDGRAGYTLLSKMRDEKIRIPFLIYAAGGNLPAHRMEALSQGAIGSTNRPTELFQMVLRALSG
jgi:CheY-like chemotaxis protein